MNSLGDKEGSLSTKSSKCLSGLSNQVPHKLLCMDMMLIDLLPEFMGGFGYDAIKQTLSKHLDTLHLHAAHWRSCDQSILYAQPGQDMREHLLNGSK